MAENLVLIISLLLIAVLLYFAIGRLFDMIDPYQHTDSGPLEEQYRIALEDVVFVRELKRYLDTDQCRFFMGSRDEVLQRLSNGDIDLAILIHEGPKPDTGMNTMQANYYTSALFLEECGIQIELLQHQARTIQVYYKDRLRPLIDEMLDQGTLAKIGDDTV